jgi:hypothetical protein
MAVISEANNKKSNKKLFLIYIFKWLIILHKNVIKRQKVFLRLIRNLLLKKAIARLKEAL